MVEKGSEVGAHILSGAVIDPIGLDRLLPDWRKEDTPIKTRGQPTIASICSTQTGALRLPNFMLPPLMSNHGNFIVSLGNVCRWLAGKAEALGVEIYPGFAAAEVLLRRQRGRALASPPATWGSARTASRKRLSPAAWSCAANTRCSRKARAVSSASS